jgi:hypothetical protein
MCRALDHVSESGKEVAMEETSAPESVATDRSGASVDDLSVLISSTRDEVLAYLTHRGPDSGDCSTWQYWRGALGTALSGSWL